MQIDAITSDLKIGANNYKVNLERENHELNGFKSVLEKAQKKGDKKALKKAAQDLEQIFINMMMKNMRQGIIKAELVEESPQRKLFEDMLYDEYSKKMAQSGGIGLADMIVKEFESKMENT